MHIEEIFSLFLEFIVFYIIIKSFLFLSLKPVVSDYFICFFIMIISCFLANYTILSWLLVPMLYLLYILYILKGKLFDSLLLYCTTYISIALFQFILVFILAFCNISLNDTYMSIIGNILTLLLAFILMLTPFQNLYQFISKTATIYKILLINSYFISTAILLYIKINSLSFYQNLTYFITITALIIIFNACILYYDRKLFIQNQILISYQKNLPIYKSLIDEIRASQHEFSNRIQNIEQLPNVCNDYDSICAALLKTTHAYKTPIKAYSLLQLNMPLLSATLYNLYCIAQENNVSVLFDIGSPIIESQAPEYELSDFVSILIQNAIESCFSKDRIYIRITSTKGKTHLEVRNPVEKEIKTQEITRFFEKGYTTKRNLKTDGITHGLGLYYLANKVPTYGGDIGADCIQFDNIYWMIFTLDI